MSEPKWYALAVTEGKESKVRKDILRESKKLDLEPFVKRVVVPRDLVTVRLKDGSTRREARCCLPGYLIAKLVYNADVFHTLEAMDGVFNVLLNRTAPSTVSECEALTIIFRNRRAAEAKKGPPKLRFRVGDEVEITAGAFKGSSGPVRSITGHESPMVEVEVKVLGRPVPVRVNYTEVRS